MRESGFTNWHVKLREDQMAQQHMASSLVTAEKQVSQICTMFYCGFGLQLLSAPTLVFMF